ncbi:hypothetical protein H310_02656 [Aphanomyces invadans]|uniref:Uncharacterized protein n=1 Tax=Aphanomyces invadans TaxID=157072 RepID=A0A024ULA0_9STRA|nr:hypothetical protein H310_02656 [Aphanomyces invadans]ETW06383.1 hypothetical protein H310_02656 [Aphanomyces invadans]|eukprot:XP_008864458.1 hypothetical protein H310_02656 [Aphanomyces invadans]
MLQDDGRMMEFEVSLYDSLVERKGAPGGNKAGVVHVASFPSDRVMQAVAKVVGYSETAFVSRRPDNSNNVYIRFFTPEGEVDLCGHATIAAFSTMPPSTTFAMHTIKSTLIVSTDSTGRVTMDQDLPIFYSPSATVISSVLESLGLDADDIDEAQYPITIASTGLPDVFVHVRSRTILADKLTPNMDLIAKVSKELSTIGYHVYTLDVDNPEYTAECRNFAPLYGIDEEAATGTSSGALGALLCHLRRRTDAETTTCRMVFSQGRSMHLPSRIESIVTVDSDGAISRVSIAGIAQSCGTQIVSVSALP